MTQDISNLPLRPYRPRYTLINLSHRKTSHRLKRRGIFLDRLDHEIPKVIESKPNIRPVEIMRVLEGTHMGAHKDFTVKITKETLRYRLRTLQQIGLVSCQRFTKAKACNVAKEGVETIRWAQEPQL